MRSPHSVGTLDPVGDEMDTVSPPAIQRPKHRYFLIALMTANFSSLYSHLPTFVAVATPVVGAVFVRRFTKSSRI